MEKPNPKKVVAVFTITVEMHIPTADPVVETRQEETRQTTLEEIKDDQTLEDDLKHGWEGPRVHTRYPERKVHTCSQCGAPHRRFRAAKGGCLECRASDIFTDKGGRIE